MILNLKVSTLTEDLELFELISNKFIFNLFEKTFRVRHRDPWTADLKPLY